MGEKYSGNGSAAIGTALAILNLFRTAAAPTSRARIFEILVGCSAAPADAATNFAINRTTAIGTEGSGFTPVNLDPVGPAAASDFGVGVFSVEPTKPANAVLLAFALNQRATFRWIAAPGCELILPATQFYGACLQSVASTVVTAHNGCILFEE